MTRGEAWTRLNIIIEDLTSLYAEQSSTLVLERRARITAYDANVETMAVTTLGREMDAQSATHAEEKISTRGEIDGLVEERNLITFGIEQGFYDDLRSSDE